MTPTEREAARILAEYDRREREIGRDFYSSTRPANLFLHQGQERALLRALAGSSLLPLGERSILEIGCGRGRWLSTLENFGATRSNLAGIDLDATRVAEATKRFPGADLRVGDATNLPWPDATFEVVFQSLVFTSIIDPSARELVATEMKRVVRRDGVILWYDFMYDNPRNHHVRGVSRAEVAALFPGHSLEFSRVSLAPPLARTIVPRSWLLAAMLERLALFNTHWFAIIRRP